MKPVEDEEYLALLEDMHEYADTNKLHFTFIMKQAMKRFFANPLGIKESTMPGIEVNVVAAIDSQIKEIEERLGSYTSLKKQLSRLRKARSVITGEKLRNKKPK